MKVIDNEEARELRWRIFENQDFKNAKIYYPNNVDRQTQYLMRKGWEVDKINGIDDGEQPN